MKLNVPFCLTFVVAAAAGSIAHSAEKNPAEKLFGEMISKLNKAKTATFAVESVVKDQLYAQSHRQPQGGQQGTHRHHDAPSRNRRRDADAIGLRRDNAGHKGRRSPTARPTHSADSRRRHSRLDLPHRLHAGFQSQPQINQRCSESAETDRHDRSRPVSAWQAREDQPT